MNPPITSFNSNFLSNTKMLSSKIKIIEITLKKINMREKWFLFMIFCTKKRGSQETFYTADYKDSRIIFVKSWDNIPKCQKWGFDTKIVKNIHSDKNVRGYTFNKCLDNSLWWVWAPCASLNETKFYRVGTKLFQSLSCRLINFSFPYLLSDTVQTLMCDPDNKIIMSW